MWSLLNGTKRGIVLGAMLLLFVFVQIGITAHQAEFGLGEHKHHGTLCQISVFNEHNKMAGTPEAVVVPVPALLPTLFTALVASWLVSNAYPSAHPRAPPALLLS